MFSKKTGCGVAPPAHHLTPGAGHTGLDPRVIPASRAATFGLALAAYTAAAEYFDTAIAEQQANTQYVTRV